MYPILFGRYSIPAKEKESGRRVWPEVDKGLLHKHKYGSKIPSIPRKLFELPESIWIELSAIVASGNLVFDEAVVDPELRETWRLPQVMKTVPFSPPIKIHGSSLSPLLISQEDLNILEPQLRLLVQHTPYPPNSNSNQHQSIIKKPHSAYANQLIREGCADWKEAWQSFLKLANGVWIDIGEYRCKLKMHTRTIGKESIEVETDCGHQYILKRNTFRMVFDRLLKKSAH